MKATFPVPRIALQLEEDWAPMLAARFGVREDDFRAQPTRFMDYPAAGCRLELVDGSVVNLRWSFAIVSMELRAVAVFSEHCGHHVFPLSEAKVYEGGRQVYPAGL